MAFYTQMYYVIQVKTGAEARVKKDIDKKISGRYFVDVFSPFRKTLRKYKGVFMETKERCFPGYLFVETDEIKQLFFDLYGIRDYIKILGREGHTYNFVPLNEDESRMVDILYNINNNRITEISDIEVAEGDTIKILDGPLVALKGRVKKVNLHKRKVTVEIPFFKREIQVDVGINIIVKSVKE